MAESADAGVASAGAAVAPEPSAAAAPIPPPAAAPVSAPPAVTPAPRPAVPAEAVVAKAKMWPQDQSWRKSGPLIKLKAQEAEGNLPDDGMEWQVSVGRGEGGIEYDVVTRVRPATPRLSVEIRDVEPGFLSLGCWPHLKQTSGKEIDEAKWLPPRLGTKVVLTSDHQFVACDDEGRLEGRKFWVPEQRSSDMTAGNVTVTTTTTRMVVKTLKADLVDFVVSYDGDFYSADFAAAAPGLEGIAAIVHDQRGMHPGVAVDLFGGFETVGFNDTAGLTAPSMKGKYPGVTPGTRLYGAKVKAVGIPFSWNPISFGIDLEVAGGNGAGYMGDFALFLGLGHWIGPVAISAMVGGGASGGFFGQIQQPLLIQGSGQGVVEINLGPPFRIMGFARANKLVHKGTGTDADLTARQKSSTTLSFADEFSIGAALEWSIFMRDAANTKKGGSTFFFGVQRSEAYQTKSLSLFVGFGAASGSWLRTPNDPDAY